ncbi:MAG: class I SAM-dependent methyltransferase [Atribacterota bacterium]|nr:class I SAM-dependent methyltransferase [Atribacterota bacterium]
MNDLSPELEKKLRIYFSEFLIKIEDNKWSTPPFKCSWALISWKSKKDLSIAGQEKNYKTNFTIIDWNQLWEEAFEASPWMKREVKPKKWNDFALRFNDGVHKGWNDRNSYINQVLRKIEKKIEASFTVLDVGCGPGTFAIPLGRKVKKVTAVDISSSMLNLAKKNAISKNIHNINYICKDWEKLTLGKDIDKHDVIIASRCLGGLNLKEKLLSLNQMANKAVYLTWIIKVSGLEKKAYQIINRRFSQEPDYIYLYNLLYQSGIYAQVDFIECDGQENYTNMEKALEYYKWILGELSLEEEDKIKNYLLSTFKKTKEGNLISPNNFKSTWGWALLYWWKA